MVQEWPGPEGIPPDGRAGPGDREECPSPETLEAFRDYTLLRTDRSVWIELMTDGNQVWVQVENK